MERKFGVREGDQAERKRGKKGGRGKEEGEEEASEEEGVKFWLGKAERERESTRETGNREKKRHKSTWRARIKIAEKCVSKQILFLLLSANKFNHCKGVGHNPSGSRIVVSPLSGYSGKLNLAEGLARPPGSRPRHGGRPRLKLYDLLLNAILACTSSSFEHTCSLVPSHPCLKIGAIGGELMVSDDRRMTPSGLPFSLASLSTAFP